VALEVKGEAAIMIPEIRMSLEILLACENEKGYTRGE